MSAQDDHWPYKPSSIPTVWADKLRRQGAIADDNRLHPGARFGFPNVERLRYWFCPQALAYLHENGYACKVYAATWGHVTRYAEQVVFDLHTSRHIRTIPLHRLIGVPCLHDSHAVSDSAL